MKIERYIDGRICILFDFNGKQDQCIVKRQEAKRVKQHLESVGATVFFSLLCIWMAEEGFEPPISSYMKKNG